MKSFVQVVDFFIGLNSTFVFKKSTCIILSTIFLEFILSRDLEESSLKLYSSSKTSNHFDFQLDNTHKVLPLKKNTKRFFY